MYAMAMALASPGSTFGVHNIAKSRSNQRMSTATRFITRASSLKLDSPQRLWETGSLTWFHGAEPPAYLDGSLRAFIHLSS